MKNELIECVIYECLINCEGNCTGEEHETSPNSVFCKNRKFRMSNRKYTEEVIKDRMMVKSLTDSVRERNNKQ